MAKEKLILVPSTFMDKNKKQDRNENGLIRMSQSTRKKMGFDKQVEVYPTESTENRLKGAMLLDIFVAFSKDISALKKEGYTDEDLKRVGFVTTKTFKKITGTSGNVNENIWISNGIEDTVIGTDPEFLLFDNKGNIIRANNVLGYHGPIGCDGAMAEVRPKPAIKPEELVENIKILLLDKSLTEPIKKYNWIASCYHKDSVRDYPVGGHIHIGNPIKIAKIKNDERVNFFKTFNKILDELLAIPMIKIDGSELGKARRTQCTMGRFGYFGEFRTCNGRLEHRTLSGLWMMHPLLATFVFGTAKAIIDEVFSLVANNDYSKDYTFNKDLTNIHIWNANFDNWSQIPLCNDIGCTKPSRDMIELLHKSAANKISIKYLKEWYGKMKNLSTYKKYSIYVDGLYEVLKNDTNTFKEYDKRIEVNWLEDKPFIN